jgi:LysR family transcriptional regulator AphB
MAVRSLALDATGFAILPSYLAHDDLASGRLIELLGEAGLPAINVFASFPHHRAGLSKIKVVVEELRSGSIKS